MEACMHASGGVGRKLLHVCLCLSFGFALSPALVNTGSAQDIPIYDRGVLDDLGEFDLDDARFPDVFKRGQDLFSARFNIQDGQGRPATTGGGAPRDPNQPDFIRTSGPDSNSCFSCHNDPRSGGAGDFAVNVFVLAQTLDPVTESVSADFSNERNTVGMHGAGPIEMLAREMTAALHAIRDAALQEAAQTQLPVRRELLAKGVQFGFVTAMPNGKIDPSEIDGVDWDLIIKPFHQKGAVVSLREFTNNAMNHHHGMQSTERFGTDTDPDADGVMNELTEDEITAVTIYQAALGTPGRNYSRNRQRFNDAREGEKIFADIGCTECHVAEMVLDDPVFTEPNPYNPSGNLQRGDEPVFSFDMTRRGERPRLKRVRGGGAVVQAFTDLKRHNLNDEELTFFANEKVPQGMMNGFADPDDFTIEPTPRPTEEFLTRKLWDAGNTAPYGHRGDLTTLSEAIYYHGGDARASRDAFLALEDNQQELVIEFLYCLQILPETPRLVIRSAP